MDFQHLLYEKRDGVLRITINHPERHNSVDDDGWLELKQAFEAADADGEIGVIVLTGAGDKAFCAGGYLKDLAEFEPEKSRRMFRNSALMFNAMRKARQPIIAAVNGYAIGGGNEVVVACDLAIASEHAKFAQVGPKVGSSPVFGGNNLLALSIGEKRAKEVVMLNHQFTAQEAFQLGWINKVVPHAELYDEVERWCQELLDRAPSYLELTKVSSNVWWDMMHQAYAHGEQVLMRLAGGAEMLEGTRAFMEKRKPNFRQFRRKK